MMIAPTPSLARMFVHPLVAHISIIMHTPEPTVNILVHATKGTYAKLIYGHHFLNFKLSDSHLKQLGL
jgi:hypothetical protein